MTNDPARLSRRGLLGAGAAAAAGTLALPAAWSAPARAADEPITLITWETYHDDPWMVEWTAKSGTPVNVIRIGSNDETYAKLRSGAVSADLYIIDIGSMPRFIAAELLVPVDPAKVANAGNISAGLRFPASTTIDGKVWGVPYNWGTQPLMFDTEVVKPAPTSWQVLWDKRYAGKVLLPDDAYITVPMVAIAIGAKDPYNLTEEEFERLAQAFRELRPQLKTLARGFDDATSLFASGDAVVGYCQNIVSVFDLQDKGKPFAFSFPAEGTPAWVDCAVVTAAGSQKPAVYGLINEMLTPAWQARFIQRSFNNGVLDDASAVKAGVPNAVLERTNIPSQNDPAFWERMSFFQNPEDVDRRLEIWNAFKAGTL